MKPLRILVLLCAALLFYAVPEAAGFNVNSIIAKMGDQTPVCGQNPETGFWIVAYADVFPEKGMNENEKHELGLAMAKKEIASFFGTTVKSSEQFSSTVKVSEENGKETSSVEEVLKEAVSVDVNQFLRGVAIAKAEDKGEFVRYYCYTSTRIINAAAEMEAEKSKLPPDTVRAVGFAPALGGESTETLQRAALASAKRYAVEQVLGSSIAANTQVQDSTKIYSRIYASASGFVEDFRIVSENRTAQGYEVRIIAKVARNKLMQDYTASLKAMGDPAFAVITNQKDLYMSLCDFFSGLGIRIIANPQAADYLILANGDFREVIHPASRQSGTQLSLWIRIVDPKTNQELFAIKNDPRKAAVFYTSVERQIELSAQKAFTQVKKPLHEKLNQLLGKMATTGREVRIVIDNYTESFSDELRIIVKAVENIPGSSNVNMKVNDIEQTATISLNYTATTESLEGFLQARLKKDIEYPVRRPKTKNISANTLTMTY